MRFLIICSVMSCVLSAENVTAYVDGGSLISLCSIIPVPDQLKTDFLESTLHAQLNANLKYDRQENGVKWYATYLSILQHIGWNVSLSGFELCNTSSVFNWSKVIENGLKDRLNIMV